MTDKLIYVVYHEPSAENLIAFETPEDAMKWIKQNKDSEELFIDVITLC